MNTEKQIFERLYASMHSAARECDLIATRWGFALEFMRLRSHLKAAEQACKELQWHRQDYRWSSMSLVMEEAHQRARKWLHTPSVASKKLFSLLAASIRKLIADIKLLEVTATNTTGMILPPNISKTPNGLYGALSRYTDSVIEKREEEKKQPPSGLILT